MRQFILTVHWNTGSRSYMFYDMAVALKQAKWIMDLCPEIKMSLRSQKVESEKWITDLFK